jgi:ribonuclease P protein component
LKKPFGFPRARRLLKSEDFTAVFDFRRVTRSQHFVLHYLEPAAARNDSVTSVQPRLGLVIGKRYLRHAVWRNLVKRIARETFRTMQAELRPRDYVLRMSAVPRASGQAPSAATAPQPGKKNRGKAAPAPVHLDRQALGAELRTLFARNRRKPGKSVDSAAPCASC